MFSFTCALPPKWPRLPRNLIHTKINFWGVWKGNANVFHTKIFTFTVSWQILIIVTNLLYYSAVLLVMCYVLQLVSSIRCWNSWRNQDTASILPPEYTNWYSPIYTKRMCVCEKEREREKEREKWESVIESCREIESGGILLTLKIIGLLYYKKFCAHVMIFSISPTITVSTTLQHRDWSAPTFREYLSR